MEIINLFLKKGFLLEPDFKDILKDTHPIIAEELVEVISNVATQNKARIISAKDFLSNIYRINILLDSIKKEKPKEKKEAIENTIAYFSSLLPKRGEEEERKKEEEGKKDKEGKEIKKEDNKEESEEESEEESKKEDEKEIVKKIGKLSIIKSYSIPSRKISVEDFTNYFRNRFIAIKNILQERAGFDNLISINKITAEKQNVSIIGMITSKSVTRNKHILIEVEDLTGRIRVLAHSGKHELMQKAKELVLDEIVAFSCNGTNEMMFANDIVFPDIGIPAVKNCPEEECAAFISDIHVGSANFLEKEFLKFVSFLNLESGSAEQKAIAEKVKYLFIAGDTVDGIGVFPKQEELLEIKDIEMQYAKLTEMLKKIRDSITIILCPGQHDAVRLAEPQPPLGSYAPGLHSIKNLVLVSNPSIVEIGAAENFEGLKVLLYHGASFHSLIDDIEELRFKKASDSPTQVIKQILKKRHLAPSHSSVVYIPTKEGDPLAICEAPDIIATGEMHRAEVGYYNNILMIASSCWQSITPFEEKVGNHPDPCKVPILNLKTREVKIIDFS